MIAELRPYPAMTDSGVPWLGKVPEHWEVSRLKSLLAARITDGPHVTPTFVAQGIPFLSVDGIQHGELVFKRCRYVSPEDHAEFIKKTAPRRDDILIGKAASTGKIARVKVDFEFSIWSPLALIRPDLAQVISGFLEYALKDVSAQDQVETLCTLNTQKNISMDDIPKLIVPLPPIPEQAAIVRFLDHADRRIRRYIRTKQKLIKLLEEQKQAIIHRAVTRGIDPYVRLKPSGVEWLGEVPKHWELRRAKQVCTAIVDCKNRTPDMFVDGAFTVVRTTNIRNGCFSLAGSYPTNQANYEIWTQRGAPRAGDVFFTREAPAGEACLVPNLNNLCMGQRMMYFRPNAEMLDAQFLLHTVYGPIVRTYIEVECNGSTVGHLRLGQVTALPILWCPIEEQRRIVAYIDEAVAPIAIAISRAQQEVSFLREYRTRLIADVVTGKLDVRAAAANLPIETDELEPPDDSEALSAGEEDTAVGDIDTLPEEADV